MLDSPCALHPRIKPGTFHLATSLLSQLSHLATLLPHDHPTSPILPPHYSPTFSTLPTDYPNASFPPSQLTTLLPFPAHHLPNYNRSLQNSKVLPLVRQGKHAPLALEDLTQAMSITRSMNSYSLIEPQPLLRISACSYEFHTLAVHRKPKFKRLQLDLHWESGWRSAVEVFLRKQSTC